MHRSGRSSYVAAIMLLLGSDSRAACISRVAKPNLRWVRATANDVIWPWHSVASSSLPKKGGGGGGSMKVRMVKEHSRFCSMKISRQGTGENTSWPTHSPRSFRCSPLPRREAVATKAHGRSSTEGEEQHQWSGRAERDFSCVSRRGLFETGCNLSVHRQSHL